MFTTAYRFCRDDGKVEDVVFVRGERVAVGLCYGCDRPRCWLIIVKGGRPGLRRPTSENPTDDKQLKFQIPHPKRSFLNAVEECPTGGGASSPGLPLQHTLTVFDTQAARQEYKADSGRMREDVARTPRNSRGAGVEGRNRRNSTPGLAEASTQMRFHREPTHLDRSLRWRAQGRSAPPGITCLGGDTRTLGISHL